MELTVKIEKLVHGGLGLARTDKGILFVPDVLPDEEVSVTPDCKLGGQMIARVVKIITPSPFRRKPPCALFGICGGCDWLHASYKVQLTSKKEIFLENLGRIGKIENVPEVEIVSSPEFGYRQRARFQTDRQTKKIGFYKRKSHEVKAIKNCPLLMPALNTFIASASENAAWLPCNDKGISVISGQHSVIASSPVLKGLTSTKTYLHINNFIFEVSGDSFFQGNAYLCEKLGLWANDLVKGDCFVDLYGGAGFFSVFLHGRFNSGVTVENIESQSMLAQKNLAENKISNVSACNDTAEHFLQNVSPSSNPIDCLIVDPPRSGLSNQVRKDIQRIKPGSIMYVSCNPATQARDISDLIKPETYFIDKMALFDLYPNTHHLETVILLRKRS